MVDFDGLLCDMQPFTGELQTGGRDRWSRFFAHTPHAEPVVAGVELLARVDALGWRYAVSTTRPAMPGVGELITNWLAAHLSSLQPPGGGVVAQESRVVGSGSQVQALHDLW